MTDKATIRDQVWDRLEERGLARFPFPPHGRIPNFDGAEEVAERLTEEPEWGEADVLKCNPDAPQLPVRRGALEGGKLVYMAVPRLAEAACFLELEPEEIDDVSAAPTVSSVETYATPRRPDEVRPVDLVVVGSVAVTSAGARIGKGEGYSDLEWALLAEHDRVGPETTVATTVHETQVVDDDVPVAAHDVPLDLILTPARTIRPDRRSDRPDGIIEAALDAERAADIPALADRSSLESNT